MPSYQKKAPLHYSRNKDRVEIAGDSKEVKPLIWFDLLTSRLTWIAITIILLVVIPKASFLPLVIKWIKSRWVMILLLVQVECLLKFSG